MCEFNLPGIIVIPEQTYYLVLEYESENTRDDIFCWWYNPNATYTRGTAWYWTVENGSKWTELDYDFCFKVIGYNSQNNHTTNTTTGDSKGISGFELIFVICAIALILFCKRKKKL